MNPQTSSKPAPQRPIVLYGYGPAFGVPDPSPFVTKVELLLKMAGLDYRIERADIRRAPKGKVPWIDDDGQIVDDSALIRWHLEDKYGVDFDAGLTAEQRSIGLAVERMIEEHLFWGAFHARWIIDRNFAAGPAQFFQAVPAIVRPMVIGFFRRRARRYLHAQGLGRHAPADRDRLLAADIAALATILGDKPFLFGKHPSAVDATLYPFVAGILSPTFISDLRVEVEKYENLITYADRCQKLWYPHGFLGK